MKKKIVLSLSMVIGIIVNGQAAIGKTVFDNFLIGTYTVTSSYLEGYTSVIDSEGDEADNSVRVIVSEGEQAAARFVDERQSIMPSQLTVANEQTQQRGSILVRVSEDTNGDLEGDEPLENVTVRLYNSEGIQLREGRTVIREGIEKYGVFIFDNLDPGIYTVKVDDLEGYTSVSDSEGLEERDNTVRVNLRDGEQAIARFVDRLKIGL